MRKRILFLIIILGILFSTQIYAQAVDYRNPSIDPNFERIDRGHPFTWTITSLSNIRAEPFLCDLEGDGKQELFIQDMDGLILVDAEDGTQLWNYYPNEGLDTLTGPKIANLNSDSILDIVITADEGIIALEGGTGATLWREYGTYQVMHGHVIMVDDFTSNSVHDILYKFENNTLALFQGETGDFLWMSSNQTKFSPLAVESVSSVSKDILAIEDDGVQESLVLLNGSNGEVVWREYENALFHRQPIVADLNNDDRYEAIFGSDTPAGEEIIAIDASNGTTLWKAPAAQTWVFGNLLAEDINQDGNLEIIVDQGLTIALDGNNGSWIWTFQSGSDHRTIGIANLTESPGMELVISDYDFIHALDAESGEPVWSSAISYTNDIEIADFDRDTLDEVVTISYGGDSYVLDGSEGNIIWYSPMGSNTYSIQIAELEEDAPIFVIYTSTYLVSCVEITGFNPNIQMTLTIIQFLPLTVGTVLFVLLIVLWKKGKLDALKVSDTYRVRMLWNRILKIDPISRKFKVSLWIIVMIFPWIWIFPINDPTMFYTFAPVWYVISMGLFNANRTYFSILGLGSLGVQLTDLLALLSLALPLIISGIILELSSRELVVFRMPRKFVISHMIVIEAVGIWLWTTGTWLIIIPIPIATITLLIADSIVRQSLPEVQKVMPVQKAVPEAAAHLKVLRGGEFVGNRLRYKVKIANESNEVVTDVKVAILSYPEESLKLESESMRTIAKLEPKGFRSPTFEFLPTTDCVKGSIIATVSFVDFSGTAHSRTTEPFVIRAVCDLLRAQKITPDEFVEKLSLLEHNDMVFKVEDWTPEEMHSKAIQSLESSNFFEVESKLDEVGEHIQSKISGYAKGVYTGKGLGIEITISGIPAQKGYT
jgi:outer membrane protein assembly factor BamB